MKKVLILTGSYGSGHNAAAQNLKAFYKTKQYKVEIVDIVNFINKFLAKTTQNFYKLSSEDFPKVWETFFNLTDSKYISRLVYAIKDPFLQPKFDNLVEKFVPNIVISVFPFWNWWVKNYIKANKKFFKWGILITDAINIQSFWYVRPKYVDYYFVIDEISKKYFIEKFDYPVGKVKVSFFPIKIDKFLNRTQVDNKNVLLLLTGLNKEFVETFLKISKANITVLKGRNEDLYNFLQANYPAKYLPYLNIIDNLRNYDIFIGKAGGAIVSECIATDTFMFVPNFFPGQEEGNVKLLEYFECGVYEPKPIKVEFLRKYLDFNKFLPNYKKVKKNSCEIIYNYLH